MHENNAQISLDFILAIVAALIFITTIGIMSQSIISMNEEIVIANELENRAFIVSDLITSSVIFNNEKLILSNTIPIINTQSGKIPCNITITETRIENTNAFEITVIAEANINGKTIEKTSKGIKQSNATYNSIIECGDLFEVNISA